MLSLSLAFISLTASLTAGQTPLHVRIDQIIEAKADYAKHAAPISDDAEFLRRVYLDLTGVIPSADEARAFLKDTVMDKRARLIDRLLASPGYARHMKTVFDVLLMDRRPGKHVKIPEWDAFLTEAFAANRPYNEIVNEILSADGVDPKRRAAARFFLDRDGEPHQLTKDISRLFLGMNLNCAQCHHHPIVTAYRQEFYYGIYAFLNRSFVFADSKTKISVFAEKAEGDVSFQSVFVPKVTMETGPRLPEGAPIDEPKLDKSKAYKVAPAKDVRPIPSFSRREQLAGNLTRTDRFARASANRLWALMLARGVVDPVDYDHEANPPSHPELMKLLAEEFAASGYDIKAFLQQVALSKTYQRSSQLPSGKEEVPEEDFAVALVRPLSPEQLAWSMMQATGMIDAERKIVGPKATDEAIFARLNKNEAIFVKMFGNQPGEPADDDFLATLDQTLFLSNGGVVRGWLAAKPGNLADRISKMTDPKDVADEVFLTVLTRFPNDEERQDVAGFLEGRLPRPAVLEDLIWAVLATAEFRFNH